MLELCYFTSESEILELPNIFILSLIIIAGNFLHCHISFKINFIISIESDWKHWIYLSVWENSILILLYPTHKMSYLLKELNKIKQFRTILQYPHLGGWGRRIILNFRPDVLYRQYLAKQDKYRLKLLGDRGSWLLSWFWEEVFPINDHSTVCSFQKEWLLSVKVIFYSMLTRIDELLSNNYKWFAIIWLLCEFSNMVHIPLIFKYLPNYSLWDTIFTFTTL